MAFGRVETRAEQVELTWEEELLQRGFSRGELLGRRNILRRQIRKKFGSVPEELDRRIDTADVPQLEAALEQILSAASPDELHL